MKQDNKFIKYLFFIRFIPVYIVFLSVRSVSSAAKLNDEILH
jgi:hypothetical protein